MKKRYLKKRNELKASKKSGTSADEVARAEKNFRPYQFLSWLDDFVQIREGRTNLPTDIDELEDEDSNYQPDDEENADNTETVERKKPNQFKTARGKKRTAKMSSSEETELQLFQTLSDRIAAKTNVLEEESEDLFCKHLALDLKKLPDFEKLNAQHEIRNIMFRYQMKRFRGDRFVNQQMNFSPPMIPQQQPFESNVLQHNQRSTNSSPFSRSNSPPAQMLSPPSCGRGHVYDNNMS